MITGNPRIDLAIAIDRKVKDEFRKSDAPTPHHRFKPGQICWYRHNGNDDEQVEIISRFSLGGSPFYCTDLYPKVREGYLKLCTI